MADREQEAGGAPDPRDLQTALGARVVQIERQLRFVMQTLSLTRHTPDGKTESRSLVSLFQEMERHAGSDTQTLADVAQRAFSRTGPTSAPGPDGFPGDPGDGPPPAARE